MAIGSLSILAIGSVIICIYALISRTLHSGVLETNFEYFLSIIVLPMLANTPVFLLGMLAAPDGKNDLALELELNCAVGIETGYLMIPLLILMGLVSGRRVPFDFPLTELLFLGIASLTANRAIVSFGQIYYLHGALLLCL